MSKLVSSLLIAALIACPLPCSADSPARRATLAPLSDFLLSGRQRVPGARRALNPLPVRDVEIPGSDFDGVFERVEPLSVFDPAEFRKKSFRMTRLRSFIASVSSSPESGAYRRSYRDILEDPAKFRESMDAYMGDHIQEDETLGDDIHFQDRKSVV